LVSIVVNNYNYAPFLRKAIASALAQTYEPLDVVVVDDGSTDGSRTVIESMGTQIRSVLKANGGQASAFNAGFAASHGEFVIFLDADDELLPTAVERAVELFGAGVVKVQWPLWEIDAAGTRTGGVQPKRPLGTGDLRQTSIASGPLSGNSAPTSGNAWTREFLTSVLPAPEREFRINADGYLNTLAWIYGQVRAIHEPQGLYRVHGANQFAAGSTEQRIERHREMFVHQCAALESHLRVLGADPQPGIWKRRKGIYDPQVEAAAKERLSAFMPTGARFILVNDNAWTDWSGGAPINGRQAIPFLEHNGAYWGKPENDAIAIRELERLRAAGADHIAFTWFATWWFEQYPALLEHLSSNFLCVLQDEFLTVFDLQSR